MNTRIKELFEQAYGDYNDANGIVIPDEFAEKFANLIVQECAKIAEKEQAYNAQFTDAVSHPQIRIDQCILIEFGL